MERLDAIVATCKKLLGITDDSRDEILAVVVSGIITLSQRYCGITEIPKDMQPVLAQLAAARYRAEGYGTEDIPMVVSSLSDSGQSVSYKATGSAAQNT